ncbi:aspartyl-phosphate phosphatase Spo0E family protein [Halobacillus sp. BBL2006]|uniref:Spo0E family sporulation regulatory protein-aspartic acid phosphatase n=1 Tax=Halobacillus sp. BBL2006 TaxID=1543706 RepID=UPI0005504EA0
MREYGGVGTIERDDLETQIEILRERMYKAYDNGNSYENIVRLSQRLDFLLNQLHKNFERKKYLIFLLILFI